VEADVPFSVHCGSPLISQKDIWELARTEIALFPSCLPRVPWISHLTRHPVIPPSFSSSRAFILRQTFRWPNLLKDTTKHATFLACLSLSSTRLIFRARYSVWIYNTILHRQAQEIDSPSYNQPNRDSSFILPHFVHQRAQAPPLVSRKLNNQG
jgi:hypothetical protein